MHFDFHKVNTANPATPPDGKFLLLYCEGMYFMGKFANGHFIEKTAWDYPQWWADAIPTGDAKEFETLRPYMTPENEPDGWTLKYFERQAAKTK